MKRFMTILAICAAATVQSQMTAGMSSGISNNHFFINGEVGYTIENLYAGLDLRSQPSGNGAAAFFGAKTFYVFRINDFHFGPTSGYYYRLASNDRKNENGPEIGYGIKAGYKWFGTEVMQIGRYTQISIGVFAFINPKNRCN